MTNRPLIVYPDADEATKQLLVGERLARIEAIGPFTIYTGQPDTPEQFLKRIEQAKGILLGWNLPDDVLSKAPDLEYISFTGIGASNFVNLDLAINKGITVTNTPGYADQTVAEHTIALLLACARKIVQLDRDTSNDGWRKDLPGFDLMGKTLGLIGLGGIGSKTAKLAQAFGMRTIAWTRNPSPERAVATGVEFKKLDDVMSESDAISLHLTVTPETKSLINQDRLAKMKSGAVLVNTARAELIDEKALMTAISDGTIAAAGLDVFHQEPLPKGHLLRAMENVITTPHTGFNTPEANNAILDIAIKNLVAYFKGEPVNVVAAPD